MKQFAILQSHCCSLLVAVGIIINIIILFENKRVFLPKHYMYSLKTSFLPGSVRDALKNINQFNSVLNHIQVVATQLGSQENFQGREVCFIAFHACQCHFSELSRIQITLPPSSSVLKVLSDLKVLRPDLRGNSVVKEITIKSTRSKCIYFHLLPDYSDNFAKYVEQKYLLFLFQVLGCH